eukprot:g38041.t1
MRKSLWWQTCRKVEKKKHFLACTLPIKFNKMSLSTSQKRAVLVVTVAAAGIAALRWFSRARQTAQMLRKLPETAVTILPYFKVHEGKLASFKGVTDICKKLVREEPGNLHYSFSYDGQVCHAREGYKDAASMLKHLENVGTPLGKVLEMSDVLRLDCVGPSKELAKLKESLAPFAPSYYELEDGGFRVESNATKHLTDKAVSIAPYFQVNPGKLTEFKQLLPKLYKKVEKEKGALTYAFGFCGDKAHVVETYSDAAALLEHLGNVDKELGEMLSLSSIALCEVHGPESEIAKLREPLSTIPGGVRFFALEPNGLRR